MIEPVRIGNKLVGAGHPVYVVAEIGINHNGDFSKAIALVEQSLEAGADAAKFQKRTVELVYTAEELAQPRESPLGKTNGDLKHGLEFNVRQYETLRAKCNEHDGHMIVSCWDTNAVGEMARIGLDAWKIASPCLTNLELLEATRDAAKLTDAPVILSTGMSTLDEIDAAVAVLRGWHGCQLILMHCVSSYPTEQNNENLRWIRDLEERYRVPVGYSGHELHLLYATRTAVAAGACIVERHIILDLESWGSDLPISVSTVDLRDVIDEIRSTEEILGTGTRRLLDCELAAKQKLRRVETLLNNSQVAT